MTVHERRIYQTGVEAGAKQKQRLINQIKVVAAGDGDPKAVLERIINLIEGTK